MLKAMRKSVQSTFVKVFLFGLLIISFGLWGVTDLFVQNPNQQIIASVADEELDYLTFAQRYQQQVRQTGLQLTPDEIEPALNRIFEQSILDAWSFDIILRQEVARLRLAVGEDQLRASIVRDPSFRDTEGNFSRRLFNNFLSANRITEAMYLESIRVNLAQNLLLQSLLQGVSNPAKITEYSEKYKNSYRQAQFLEIVASPLMNIAPASEGDIQTFYNQNQNLFEVPERRTIGLLDLSLSQIAETITPSEEELENYYALNREQLLTPESRQVERILFVSEDAARQAWLALQEGQDFLQVAQDFADMDENSLSLGEIRRDNYADQRVADTAFRLSENAFSEPFEGIFGWMIIRLTQITPEYAPSFADLREQMVNELKLEKANERIFDFVDQAEDLIASGAILAEISAEIGLVAESRQISVVEETEDPLLASQSENLENIGDLQLFEDNTGGYRLVSLTDIQEAHISELADIRADVETLWATEQQRAFALEQANALAMRINDGADIRELAENTGLAIRQTQAVNRDGTVHTPEGVTNLGNLITPELAHIPELFSLEENEAVAIASQKGAQVLVLSGIFSVSPPATASVHNADSALKNMLSTEAFSAMIDALRENYPITVNREVIDQLYSDLSNPQPLNYSPTM